MRNFIRISMIIILLAILLWFVASIFGAYNMLAS